MTDMQKISGGCNGEGLHGRKPHRPSLDGLKNNDHKTQDASPAESEKEKKTYGRTPDGTGMTVLHSSNVTFASFLPPRNLRHHLVRGSMLGAEWLLGCMNILCNCANSHDL